VDLLNIRILWGVMLPLGRKFREFRAFETWVTFYPQTQTSQKTWIFFSTHYSFFIPKFASM